MNKHTKLLVGILVAVLFLLILAIISFWGSISKNSEAEQSTGNSGTDIVNQDGNQIIEGENHRYGMIDSGGNLIIDAEWEQLHFIGKEYLTAVKTIFNDTRTGILDLEGNVVVPFVYDDISALTSSYYVASFAESKQIVIYDSTFRAVGSIVGDAYQLEKTQLTLTHGEDAFTFDLSENPALLTNMQLSRMEEEVPFHVGLTNPSKQNMLSPNEWSYVTDLAQACLTMFKTQDMDAAGQLTDAEHLSKIQSAAKLSDAKVTHIDQTLYLTISLAEKERPILVYQIGADIRREGTIKEQTISFAVTKNAEEIWVVTELQIH